jgi:hypothetical protein
VLKGRLKSFRRSGLAVEKQLKGGALTLAGWCYKVATEPGKQGSPQKVETPGVAARVSAQQRKKEAIMTSGTTARTAFLVSLAVFAFAFAASSGSHPAGAARPRPESAKSHCAAMGGTITTNFGGIDQSTTLGTATGDLRGAVAGTLLGAPQPGTGNTVVFHIQHHWVTETGDTLFFDPATATTVPLSQTLFAIVTYPVHLTGGTGKFAGATGDLTAIGEVDLVNGTVFRYSGQVCYAAPDGD